MLTIDKQNENHFLLIHVSGEADASSSIHLDKAIRDAMDEGMPQILIDCTNLNYISSAGLGVFMSYIEEINQKSISFIIFGLSEKVLKVFGILGLDQLLTIKKDKEEAIETLNAV
ncbi:anti-sigma B factor antagonist [Roseivirga pacifica]|jgi:anti-sigma B factor antagonist|uniref:Anti-sigma factor antagonist n=1 Tax=Roseivirga pacifica TaxID=1267423 RepID=A0A1I0N9A4_9BACT|nr:STAS domain-containing protein [Roseivirga pacifica]MCO6359523.1 anti-sigma factor antagonist [Roseivirga pacifica]MCO6366893.1 anti-sigma factor antagonist [Roseivirga pacifica]MCO6370575.1 anti-sigma factor antagonist [Roseivirga pacifica]MCO6374550.1 anti-sigma factor antagonist [Roseivirga pacifica]MCO6379808.1 anti-sigma factor antagonist [Roseivirga pacifica]